MRVVPALPGPLLGGDEEPAAQPGHPVPWLPSVAKIHRGGADAPAVVPMRVVVPGAPSAVEGACRAAAEP